MQKFSAPGKVRKQPEILCLTQGHPNGTLGQVVGERHTQIAHEAQHLLLSLKQPAQQVEGAGLLDPAALSGRLGRRHVLRLAFVHQGAVLAGKGFELRGRHSRIGLARGLAGLLSGQQQLDEALRPRLRGGLFLINQLG